jgi:putative FmdB family regulatory protein
MPTYEYRCGHCGRFQTVQPITEPALTVCPTCGQPVERLISRNVGIIFKGPGFYCTDHRSNTCLSGAEEKGEKKMTADVKAEAKTPQAKTGSGAAGTDRSEKTPAPAAGKK